MSDWLEGAGAEVQEDSLDALQQLVDALLHARTRASDLQDELAVVNDRIRKMEGEDIPNILLQRGITSLKLTDGKTVAIQEKLKAAVPKDFTARKKVLMWLTEHGGGGMIKDQVKFEDPEEEVLDLMRRKGIPFSREQNVNTNTFQAWCRGVLGLKKGHLAVMEASDFPAECNLYIYKTTNITEAK